MNKEQIIKLLNEFQNECNYNVAFSIDNSFKGMDRILYTLYSSNERYSLSDFSNILNVSCARVTNLVKKLAKSKLVYRVKDKKDNRTTYIYLTDGGKEFTEKKVNDVVKIISRLADDIGEDKLLRYLETTKELKEKLQIIAKEEKLC